MCLERNQTLFLGVAEGRGGELRAGAVAGTLGTGWETAGREEVSRRAPVTGAAAALALLCDAVAAVVSRAGLREMGANSTSVLSSSELTSELSEREPGGVDMGSCTCEEKQREWKIKEYIYKSYIERSKCYVEVKILFVFLKSSWLSYKKHKWRLSKHVSILNLSFKLQKWHKSEKCPYQSGLSKI